MQTVFRFVVARVDTASTKVFFIICEISQYRVYVHVREILFNLKEVGANEFSIKIVPIPYNFEKKTNI